MQSSQIPASSVKYSYSILLDDNDDKAINKYYHVESCSNIYI